MQTPDARGPLISVITICLNARLFIAQTIESVLSQTYPHMQYIIIDGGSQDGTVEIIRRYESRLAYWHSRPDRGRVHAFNLGWAQAKGEWLLYLNADDFLLDATVLEKMARHLLLHYHADVVYGKLISLAREKDPKPVPLCKVGGGEWSWPQFRRQNLIPHPAAFTRRDYFERVGGFDEDYRISMDYEHYLRAGKDLKAQFVPLPVAGMRTGGICVQNLAGTLADDRRAQIKNRALPKWQADLNLVMRVCRLYGGVMAHLVLDPMAGKIRLPGRN